MQKLRTDPSRISDLQAFLLQAGFAAVRVDTDTIDVFVSPPASPGSERHELQAVLRTWLESHPGAVAELAA